MNRTEPLHWPEVWLRAGPVDRLLKSVPFWGLADRAHRDLQRQMAARPIESLDAWARDGRLPYCFLYVSAVAKSYLFWEDIRFAPDDPCEILFSYPGIRRLISGFQGLQGSSGNCNKRSTCLRRLMLGFQGLQGL